MSESIPERKAKMADGETSEWKLQLKLLHVAEADQASQFLQSKQIEKKQEDWLLRVGKNLQFLMFQLVETNLPLPASPQTQAGVLPSPRAGPLNWVLRGSRAMFPTSLVSASIMLEW